MTTRAEFLDRCRLDGELHTVPRFSVLWTVRRATRAALLRACALPLDGRDRAALLAANLDDRQPNTVREALDLDAANEAADLARELRRTRDHEKHVRDLERRLPEARSVSTFQAPEVLTREPAA